MSTLAATPDADLRSAYSAVRALTDRLARPLSPEDQTAQSMPDASPTKWHRAHTSWFFEEFVLRPAGAYSAYDDAFRYLFNSCYEAVGPRHPRAARGLLTRPGTAEIGLYRTHGGSAEQDLVTLGLHHEQQHQELLVMDAKHLLSCHPFGPAMLEQPVEDTRSRPR